MDDFVTVGTQKNAPPPVLHATRLNVPGKCQINNVLSFLFCIQTNGVGKQRDKRRYNYMGDGEKVKR